MRRGSEQIIGDQVEKLDHLQQDLHLKSLWVGQAAGALE
jgi:hypothetical protein